MPTVPIHWLTAHGYDIAALRAFASEATDRAGKPALAIPVGDTRWREMVDARNRNRHARAAPATLALANPARRGLPPPAEIDPSFDPEAERVRLRRGGCCDRPRQ